MEWNRRSSALFFLLLLLPPLSCALSWGSCYALQSASSAEGSDGRFYVKEKIKCRTRNNEGKRDEKIGKIDTRKEKRRTEGVA